MAVIRIIFQFVFDLYIFSRLLLDALVAREPGLSLLGRTCAVVFSRTKVVRDQSDVVDSGLLELGREVLVCTVESLAANCA